MNWLFLLGLISMAFGHQTSLTGGGRPLYWPNPNVPVRINTNTTDLDPSTITSIINSSMNEWNSTGVVNITAASASVNEIRFSNNFAMYGSAVIGLTEISYNPAGAINKAVILLNDNYNFTAQQNSFGAGSVFLGDVITHEMGHFFGLSHSEIFDSSMFYTTFPGQSSISDDDRAGVAQKYGGSVGSISGWVKGGNHIGVLGVHVQAISRKTGNSVGVVTDEDGHFSIKGLNLEDTYYIYTAPLKNIDSHPGYFSNVQKEFCPGSYTGSFFSVCGREYEGTPQGIDLRTGSSNVNIGVITINCGLKANEDYSHQKLQTTFAPVTIWSNEETTLREKAFVGYFNKMSSLSWSPWETLRVDLSGITGIFGRTLKIQFISHTLGSLLEYEMRVLRNGVLQYTSTISSDPLLGTFNNDMAQAYTLADTSSNVFDVQVRARKMGNSLVPLTFPSSTIFTSDSHMPYLMMIGIWNGSTPMFNTQSFLSDNESCLDAPFTYKVNKSQGVSESITDESTAAAAGASCGTIEPPRDGGPGSSLPLLIIGFALSFIVIQFGKKAKKFLS